MTAAFTAFTFTRCSGDHRQGGGTTVRDDSDTKF